MIRLLSCLILAAPLAAGVAPFAPRSAHACSCVGLDGSYYRVRQSLDSADAAIIGEVVALSTTYEADVQRSVTDAHVVVEQRFAGDVEGVITVRQDSDSAGCGYDIESIHERHFMLLRRGEDGVLRTSLCSAFRFPGIYEPIDSASPYRDFLDTLTRIAPPVTLPPPDIQESSVADGGDDGAPAWTIVTATLAAVAVVSGVVWIVRRRGA